MESEVRRTGNGELLNLKSEKNGTEFDMYKGVDGQLFHDVFGVVIGYTKIGDEYLVVTMVSNRKKSLNDQSLHITKKNRHEPSRVMPL